MDDGKRSVYLQVADGIKREIRTGIIADGEKLPSCRELALKMGINPNTVQRAYTLLESEGFIVTVPKKGAYAKTSPFNDDLISSCETYLRSLKSSGIGSEQILQIIDKVWSDKE